MPDIDITYINAPDVKALALSDAEIIAVSALQTSRSDGPCWSKRRRWVSARP